MNIIQTKIDEYENFPALVLGLDGWVLKSVPSDVRSQFLRAYARALQIAFHPDRASNEEAARSHERYLQVVSEAISYLSENAINYELATDSVPAKRNPFVALRSGIEVRDELIEKKEKEMAALNDKLAMTESLNRDLHLEKSRALKAMEGALYSGYRMRHWMNAHAFNSVPIRIGRLEFMGSERSQEEIAEAISENKFPSKPGRTLTLKHGRIDGVRIMGAASLLHLQEYVASCNMWGLRNLPVDHVLSIAKPESLANFVVPIVSDGMILITYGELRFFCIHALPKASAQLKVMTDAVSKLDSELKEKTSALKVSERLLKKLQNKFNKLNHSQINSA